MFYLTDELFAQDVSFVSNQFIVMFEDKFDASIFETDKKFNKNFKLKKCLSKISNIWLFECVNGDLDFTSSLVELSTMKGVKFAQPDHYIVHRAIPNDNFFSQQWSLMNTGQSNGTVDADIDATEAWDYSTSPVTANGDSIVIAVIDGGFLLSHPDINFWKNWNEIPFNGIDDDANGYTDDFDGWDALTQSPFIQNNSHGTHVAGIIGAKGNNNLGISGVHWNIKILPVSGTTQLESEAVEAYSYVLNMRRLYNQSGGQKGAYIVACNTSFGVDFGQSSNFPIWCAMFDSLGSVGVLSLCATANQNINVDQLGDIPSTCFSDYLLSITNTDRNDLKSSFGGYGLVSVDLGAPGTSIFSTFSNQSTQATYNTSSGTSMASPHAAGVIALMYSSACQSLLNQYQYHPDSLSLIMKQYLLSGVDVNTSLNGITSSGGRLNANNAIYDLLVNACGYISNVKSFPHLNSIFSISPNPNSGGVLNVQLISKTTGNSKVSVVNCIGDIVHQQEISLLVGKNTILLDVSSLEDGLYTLYFEGGEAAKFINKD